MAKLIDREYPFCSERKEFRMVMRALRAGWVDDEAASELIDQALARVSNNGEIRESLSVLRTAVTIDKRRLKLFRAQCKADLQRARAELLKQQMELAEYRARIRAFAIHGSPATPIEE